MGFGFVRWSLELFEFWMFGSAGLTVGIRILLAAEGAERREDLGEGSPQAVVDRWGGKGDIESQHLVSRHPGC